MAMPRVGPPVKYDAIDAGIADQIRADDLTFAREKVQQVGRNAGAMHAA